MRTKTIGDRQTIAKLGREWHQCLLGVVERHVYAWLMCGDSAMWQDKELYWRSIQALQVLQNERTG